MICPRCAAIADDLARYRDAHPDLRGGPPAHLPAICRDFGRPGCGCQHGQPHREDPSKCLGSQPT